MGSRADWYVLLAACGLIGCSGGRYIANPSAPMQLGVGEEKSGITVELHHVILPNGPGSWVKGAPWIECVLTITNQTSGEVSLQTIRLRDSRGAYVQSNWPTLMSLESESEKVAKSYGGFAVESAASEAATRGAVEAGLAGVPGGGALVGLLGTAPHQLGGLASARDQDQLEAEFQKRRLPEPLQLAVAGSVRGSVFFPNVPQPQALVVNVATRNPSGGLTEIEIPLSSLSR